MKSLLLIPFFLLTLFCNGQSPIVKIDYDYFLLGTLNDYMGREKYKKTTNRVDEYWKNDKSLVSFLDSVSKNKYQDLTITTNKKSGRLELQSKMLAKKMNDFFDFKPSSRGAYNGEVDLNTLNLDSLAKRPDFFKTHFDTIYTGKIKGDIFKNNNQRYSFIAGAYIRFGGQKEALYYISVPNSTSKISIATELLKDLNCTNVEYVIKKTIPVQHTVYFTPTEELKNYFKTIKKML